MAEKSLFALTEEAMQINKILFETNGELTPELEKRLDELDITSQDKVEAYSVTCERFLIEYDWLKRKADELLKIARAYKAVEERLRENIKRHMLALGLKEAKGNTIRYVISQTKEKLVIDEDKLSDKYKMSVTTLEPDNERIREELNKGEHVEGAELQGGFALRKYVRGAE